MEESKYGVAFGDEIVQISFHELQSINIMLEREPKSHKAALEAIDIILNRHVLNKALNTITGRDSHKWEVQPN